MYRYIILDCNLPTANAPPPSPSTSLSFLHVISSSFAYDLLFTSASKRASHANFLPAVYVIWLTSFVPLPHLHTSLFFLSFFLILLRQPLRSPPLLTSPDLFLFLPLLFFLVFPRLIYPPPPPFIPLPSHPLPSHTLHSLPLPPFYSLPPSFTTSPLPSPPIQYSRASSPKE